MIRRALIAVVAVLALAACTPEQVAYWWDWHDRDPAAADAFFDAYQAQRLELTTGRPCAEWYDLSLDAGWAPSDWPTLSHIMWRESRCSPSAHNRSGATGLIQIMPSWIGPCGGVDLYDPAANLACGRYVLAVQGWGAWSTFRGRGR